MESSYAEGTRPDSVAVGTTGEGFSPSSRDHSRLALPPSFSPPIRLLRRRPLANEGDEPRAGRSASRACPNRPRPPSLFNPLPPLPRLIPLPPGSRENLLDWIGENASAIDADAVNQKFHEAGILQTDEQVAFAFKTGRDSLYLTNKRFFMIDVQVSASRTVTFACFWSPDGERKHSKRVIAYSSHLA